ncbi:MAG: hypothetical protein HYS27_23135 [Deltaproteobacteria bacterium]|nr:hypothetical protein [Deltaproteobacteria bacterium]
MRNERRTNVDVELLAKSELVRAFMSRTLDEHRDPPSGVVLVTDVAAAAALAFDLHHDDGTEARALLNVAAQVVALDLVCALART